MTDEDLKNIVASLAVGQAKTEASLAGLAASQQQTEVALAGLAASQQQTQAEVAETSRVLKEIGRRMGAMGSSQGEVAEEFFYNSLMDRPRLGDVEFDTITPNLIIGKKGQQSEFDLVMVNGQSVALIEVNYKARVDDLDQIDAQIKRYRSARPEHKDFKIYAGLAGFSVPAEVVNVAHERGYFVLKRKGDVMETDARSARVF